MASTREAAACSPRNATPVGRGERVLMKEVAYAEIKKRILSGEYEQGRFLSERQLALTLKMSQTPVRAALEKLQMERFIAISPQQGIVVCDLTIHEIADHFEFREAIEVYVVRHVAGRLTPQQVERVQANLEQQQHSIRAGDVPAYIQQDSAFHLMLCEFLGNREFMTVMEQLRDKIHRVIVRVQTRSPQRLEIGYREHVQIADAVVRGDSEEAARLIAFHLERGRVILLSPRNAAT